MRKYIKQWRKGCNIVVVNIDKCSDSEVSVVVIVPRGRLSSADDQLARCPATVRSLLTVLCM